MVPNASTSGNVCQICQDVPSEIIISMKNIYMKNIYEKVSTEERKVIRDGVKLPKITTQ